MALDVTRHLPALGIAWGEMWEGRCGGEGDADVDADADADDMLVGWLFGWSLIGWMRVLHEVEVLYLLQFYFQCFCCCFTLKMCEDEFKASKLKD